MFAKSMCDILCIVHIGRVLLALCTFIRVKNENSLLYIIASTEFKLILLSNNMRIEWIFSV